MFGAAEVGGEGAEGVAEELRGLGVGHGGHPFLECEGTGRGDACLKFEIGFVSLGSDGEYL